VEKHLDDAVDDPFFPRRGQRLFSEDHDGQKSVDGAEKDVHEITGLDVAAEKAVRLSLQDDLPAEGEKPVEFVPAFAVGMIDKSPGNLGNEDGDLIRLVA